MNSRVRQLGGKHRRAPSSHIELLEERWLLSTFTVTNNTDSGPGTLRQAILSANANKGTDTIDFNIKVGAISEVAIPTINSGPLGITTGADGNLWFTEGTGNQIGQITPSGIITEFTIHTPVSTPTGITAGPDGNVWFTEHSGNQIGFITPTGTITEFPLGTFGTSPEGITAGPDGNLWFTQNGFNSQIGRITPNGAITEYPITFDSGPLGITAGPDGNLWFTEEVGNAIGRITPTGTVAEFTVPTPNSQPEDITVGPDGNLWFTEFNGNQIGMINPTTDAITEFPIPTAGSFPIGITAGPGGTLWFAESNGNQIGMINPTTHAITEFPVPTAGSLPFGITAGPDGNLWFTEKDGNQIGRLTLASSGLTITPTSSLPPITDPVTIDGTTQPGFAGTPIIELDGALAGAGVNGLTIAAGGGGSTVQGLVINRFAGIFGRSGRVGGIGIVLQTNGNVIQGNFVGTDVSGTVTEANTDAGVLVDSPNNTIGGVTTGARNVISGNNGGIINGATLGNGITIPLGISGNLVLGNFIGTDVTGTRALANGHTGVEVDGPNNTVGGTTPGARNLISGNGASGILLFSSSASSNLVQGNFIGTDVTGTATLGNAVAGVFITSGASSNTIGGTMPGASNLISGNNSVGVQIDSGASGNLVQGNFIGTDATGAIALGNGGSGLSVFSSNNTIGGPSLAARNLISGNGLDGINLTNAAATGNLVQGNFIGTDATGGNKLGNARFGVVINSVINSGSPSGSNNTIGGSVTGAGNLISGNDSFGVVINGPYGGATGNVVQGNLIGTDASGERNLGNTGDGIVLSSAAGNTIGGTHISARNLISGSGRYGVVIESTTSTGNLVQGNWIGTDKTGVSAISNALDGVIIQLGASSNTVGGVSFGAGNLISGNIENGVEITGAGTAGNFVVGNRIGTTADGNAPLPNQLDGISIASGATSNTIGGMTGAPGTGPGNVISGNDGVGVQIDSGALGNLLQGNLIGTDVSGTAPLANLSSGISIQSASANTVGGTVAGTGNVISGNGGYGVAIIGTANAITGNRIGTNANGDARLGNTLDGILLTNASSNNITGNVVSGNGIGQDAAGINLMENASNNTIARNMIGTSADGTAGLGNSLAGILVGNGSSGNTIGPDNVISGNGTAANRGIGVYLFSDNTSGNVLQGNLIGTNQDGTRAITSSVIGVLINQSSGNVVQNNVISGNQVIGIEIAGATAHSNIVQANVIGTNSDGTAAIPNGADGIFINNAPGNTIGGTTKVAGNLVSGNGQVGIQIFGLGARGNLIQNNTLGRNPSGGVGPGLLNGDSNDLGIYVNTTPTINTIVANMGQGLRDSPTGAPFFPRDPGSVKGASTRVLRPGKHARPFAHRPFLKARSRPASSAGQTSHVWNRFSHR